MKRKVRNKKWGCLVQALLLCICIGSAAMLTYEMILQPRQNRELAEELKDSFPEIPSPEDSSQGESPKQAGEEPEVSAVDLSSLQAQFPDVQGWLTIPDTGIDYPVLKSSVDDPEYYLRRNYKEDYDINGSLFFQADCSLTESGNRIIYGHNMNSGAMFGNLEKYAAKSYWQEHPKVFLQTAAGMEVYEIAAVLKADVSMFLFQQAAFQNQRDAEAYVEQAKAQSLFETGVDGAECETVLTLVTCSYEWKEERNIVVAVKVQPETDDERQKCSP